MELNNINWVIKDFNELTPFELYGIMKLRIDVFVVEQNCPYPDVDGKDLKSRHVIGLNDGQIIAYSRIVFPGVSYKEVSIGRVATHLSYRKVGLGKALMEQTFASVYQTFGKAPIRISAQQYLTQFYQALGFAQVSEPYMEDDIPHVQMLKDK